MISSFSLAVYVLGIMLPAAPSTEGQRSVRVGSKSFTESVILGEIVALIAEHQGIEVERAAGIGGTRLLWEALKAGQIDIYPEYTGTLSEEIFAGQDVHGVPALRKKLAHLDLQMTASLGFNNTYVIGMKEKLAARLSIRTISDLRDHPELILRFSNEFMKRADGWEGLARQYQLPQQNVRGLEHALAYQAIADSVIDVTDLYATDAKIRELGLRRLEDNQSYFPAYRAVLVYRSDLAERAPGLVASLQMLEGTMDENEMTGMNSAVEISGRSEGRVAAKFISDHLGIKVQPVRRHLRDDVVRYSLEHLRMVGISLGTALLVAIPLGIVGARWARLAQPILAIVGIIQTIPAIALLVLLIRPVSYFSGELGFPQAVVALFLYSLLPIVRNTHSGLTNIAPQLHESAIALGLPSAARLWRVELPLAAPSILTGIKTAAVLNVGFATLGGFIGAGGFGEPIFTGIRLNDYGVILQGAVPAALLALLVQGLFELIERWTVPKGLRLRIAA